MNATADLSILTLIANASIVVKIVLAILIVLSLASWTVIFRKFFAITRATRQTDDFESRFWSGTELTKLLETANRSRDAAGMEERIFAAGMNEFMKQRQSPASGGDVVNRVSRAMRAVPRPSSMSSSDVAARSSSAVESAPPDTMRTTGARRLSSRLDDGLWNRWSVRANLLLTLGNAASVRTSAPRRRAAGPPRLSVARMLVASK